MPWKIAKRRLKKSNVDGLTSRIVCFEKIRKKKRQKEDGTMNLRE